MPVDEQTIEAIGALLPEGDWVEAMNDPDASAVRRAALRAVATDDLEVAMIGPGGFAGTFSGAEALQSAWRDWLAPFASYRLELEPEVRAGDDTVVFFARQVATPKGASAPMENDGASVFFFRDGKVHRIEFHLERASALRSAGLE